MNQPERQCPYPSHLGLCQVPSKLWVVLKSSNSPLAPAAAVFASNAATRTPRIEWEGGELSAASKIFRRPLEIPHAESLLACKSSSESNFSGVDDLAW